MNFVNEWGVEMSRDWTQEEFKQKDGKMTEECRLITKEEWDNYLLTCKTCEELYKCLLNIVEAESWEEAHDLAEDMIVKYADKFDVNNL